MRLSWPQMQWRNSGKRRLSSAPVPISAIPGPPTSFACSGNSPVSLEVPAPKLHHHFTSFWPNGELLCIFLLSSGTPDITRPETLAPHYCLVCIWDQLTQSSACDCAAAVSSFPFSSSSGDHWFDCFSSNFHSSPPFQLLHLRPRNFPAVWLTTHNIPTTPSRS